MTELGISTWLSNFYVIVRLTYQRPHSKAWFGKVRQIPPSGYSLLGEMSVYPGDLNAYPPRFPVPDYLVTSRAGNSFPAYYPIATRQFASPSWRHSQIFGLHPGCGLDPVVRQWGRVEAWPNRNSVGVASGATQSRSIENHVRGDSGICGGQL